MGDAGRYQKDFDLIMQEVEAEARRRGNADRDAAWKKLKPSFSVMADANGWTFEQREKKKQFILDAVFSDPGTQI